MRSEIIKDMPLADYLAAEEIGSSTFKAIHCRSPRAYKMAVKGETDAMRAGTAVHLAIGQPELFEEQVVAFDGTRRGKAWDAFQADHAGLTILKRGPYDEMRLIADAVRAHPVAGPVLEQVTDWEVSLFWNGLKARLDGIAPSSVLEIKSAASAAPQLFAAQCARLGYHLQFAMYLDGARELIDPRLALMLIVVEKTPPYEVAVYDVPDDLLQVGREAYRQARACLAACKETNIWPGAYDDGPLELRLPRWAEPEKEELQRADYSGLEF